MKANSGMAVLFAALGSFGSAQAGTATADLRTQATITTGCSVVGNTLDFGDVNLSHVRGRRVQTNIDVTCTKDLPFQVGIGDGSNALTGQRRLKNEASDDYISYELYKSRFRNDRFGDAIHTQRVKGVGNGTVPVVVPVYGEILSRQSAAGGTYVDDAMITVYF